MITSIMSANVYVDDFERAVRFYGETLQLKRGGSMGDASCFFWIGENKHGLFLDGGYKPLRANEDQTRAAFTLKVDSAQDLFARLKAAGAETLTDAPKDMGAPRSELYSNQRVQIETSALKAIGMCNERVRQ